MDTAKSVRFILDKGSDLEKARIRWILYGVKPGPNVARALSELQSADGGFPLGAWVANSIPLAGHWAWAAVPAHHSARRAGACPALDTTAQQALNGLLAGTPALCYNGWQLTSFFTP
jgi:hypothetical protein